MTTILQVRDLTTYLVLEGKSYPVIQDLNFDLKEGQTLALLGESGCGKSFTALSLLRILPTPPALPPQGEVLYKGTDLFKLSEAQMQRIRGRKIAMIFQDPMSALNPVYTIGDQIYEMAKQHLNLEHADLEELVIKALEDVHLPHPKERMREYPHQMSGGMLQRAMIAMALICSPDVLIADEPTTALDVTIQAQILALLRELQEKKGMATLLITHDMGVVAEMADEVVVMYGGEKIEHAPVETLFDHSSHPYTQALFAARPHQSLSTGKLPTIEGTVPRLSDMPEGCSFHPRCRWAMDLCKKKSVPSFALPQKDHHVKCWLFDEELQWKLDDDENP